MFLILTLFPFCFDICGAAKVVPERSLEADGIEAPPTVLLEAAIKRASMDDDISPLCGELEEELNRLDILILAFEQKEQERIADELRERCCLLRCCCVPKPSPLIDRMKRRFAVCHHLVREKVQGSFLASFSDEASQLLTEMKDLYAGFRKGCRSVDATDLNRIEHDLLTEAFVKELRKEVQFMSTERVKRLIKESGKLQIQRLVGSQMLRGSRYHASGRRETT